MSGGTTVVLPLPAPILLLSALTFTRCSLMIKCLCIPRRVFLVVSMLANPMAAKQPFALNVVEPTTHARFIHSPILYKLEIQVAHHVVIVTHLAMTHTHFRTRTTILLDGLPRPSHLNAIPARRLLSWMQPREALLIPNMQSLRPKGIITHISTVCTAFSRYFALFDG